VEEFRKFGPVEIRVCEGFAFADYQSQREADDAMFELEPMLKNDGNIAGYQCTLAWGKRSIIAKYQQARPQTYTGPRGRSSASRFPPGATGNWLISASHVEDA
jgi:hypothetical protein